TAAWQSRWRLPVVARKRLYSNRFRLPAAGLNSTRGAASVAILATTDAECDERLLMIPEDSGQSGSNVFDDGEPTAARVYDVMLNGKDNYRIDRQVAEASLAVMPELKEIALHNRAILHRVVRHLAVEEGITQFLDIGSGLPT